MADTMKVLVVHFLGMIRQLHSMIIPKDGHARNFLPALARAASAGTFIHPHLWRAVGQAKDQGLFRRQVEGFGGRIIVDIARRRLPSQPFCIPVPMHR